MSSYHSQNIQPETRQAWKSIIVRYMRLEIKFRRDVIDLFSEHLGTNEKDHPILTDFGNILFSTFDAAVNEPSLEPLDDREQGRFAVHVILTCIDEFGVQHARLDEDAYEKKRRTSLAVGQISQCFKDRSREFKESLVAEFNSATAKLRS